MITNPPCVQQEGPHFKLLAVLAWQLSGTPVQTLALLCGTAWVLVICFAAVAGVSLIYTFVIPTGFSILIMLCFAAAAWASTKHTAALSRLFLSARG